MVNFFLLITAVVINVVTASLLAPVLDGVERRVRARIQCRRGPPVLQTWYDIIKLLRKGRASLNQPLVFRLGPYTSLATSLAALTLLPTLLPQSLSFFGDAILLIYLLATASIILAIASASSGNPLASLGSCRELSLAITSEFCLAVALTAIFIDRSSLMLSKILPPYPPITPSILIAIGTVGFITYVEGGRLPFDIPEAEPEISGGVFIEYGGSDLGIAIYSVLIKRLVLATLLIDLVLPRNVLINYLSKYLVTYLPYYILPYVTYAVVASVYIALLFLITTSYATIAALYGRFRLDQAVPLIKGSVIIAGVAVLAALMGF